MNIKFPQHVIDFLNAKGFKGEPEHWPFQAVALSENRAYLLFSQQAGFIVTDSDWELASMAKVALTAADKTALSGRGMNLENIKGIERMVWLFPDGSLQWLEGDVVKIAQPSDGSTWKTLDTWCVALAKKEASWAAKLLGQRQMYTVMRASLQAWGSQLKEKLGVTKTVSKA